MNRSDTYSEHALWPNAPGHPDSHDATGDAHASDRGLVTAAPQGAKEGSEGTSRGSSATRGRKGPDPDGAGSRPVRSTQVGTSQFRTARASREAPASTGVTGDGRRGDGRNMGAGPRCRVGGFGVGGGGGDAPRSADWPIDARPAVGRSAGAATDGDNLRAGSRRGNAAGSAGRRIRASRDYSRPIHGSGSALDRTVPAPVGNHPATGGVLTCAAVAGRCASGGGGSHDHISARPVRRAAVTLPSAGGVAGRARSGRLRTRLDLIFGGSRG